MTTPALKRVSYSPQDRGNSCFKKDSAHWRGRHNSGYLRIRIRRIAKMAIIEWKKENKVAVITLCNGENKQHLDFAMELKKTLEEVENDAEVNAAIITSADEKAFSMGVDVDWVQAKMKEKDADSIKYFMYGMNDNFKKLMTFPVPVIAAINGHAFGNGAILTCACDFRFMKADRGYFCFPEVNMSIPFLPGMLAFVKKAIPLQNFNKMYLSGARLKGKQMKEYEIIEKACEDDADLMKTALEFAGQFEKNRKIFTEHKKRLYKDIFRIMDEEDKEYIDTLSLFV